MRKMKILSCPKCNQNTFEETNHRYATERYCNNCGYFNCKHLECCDDPFPKPVRYQQKVKETYILIVREQCMSCGKLLRTPAISKKKVNLEGLKEFDTRLALARIEEMREISAHYDELYKTNWYRQNLFYQKYLQGEAWANKRIEILKRDNHLCQKCHTAIASQVHHESYKRIGNELSEDLLSVCFECHLKIHQVECFW